MIRKVDPFVTEGPDILSTLGDNVDVHKLYSDDADSSISQQLILTSLFGEFGGSEFTNAPFADEKLVIIDRRISELIGEHFSTIRDNGLPEVITRKLGMLTELRAAVYEEVLRTVDGASSWAYRSGFDAGQRSIIDRLREAGWTDDKIKSLRTPD